MDPPESKTDTEEELKRPTKKKRRLSSILKAPRTPLKSIVADNEDSQEEMAKPTEKKKSRRVSFASTNDIHVFIKDFKNCSFESQLQDLSGTALRFACIGLRNAPQSEYVIREATDNAMETGMETLLNAPLHASQHQNKENIFGYGGQNDFCDRTVVFSEEDAAFMDMTHSHTIIIDNKADGTDAAMSSCEILGLTTAGGDKISSFDDSARERTAFKSCSPSGKGQIKEFELEDFLASLTQSSGSGRFSGNIKSVNLATPLSKVPSPTPKVDSKSFLARLRAHRSTVDQENQVPVVTRKSAHQDGSSQQRSHWLNDRTTSVEQENMELTKTQTAIIGDAGLFKHKSFAPSQEQEDMDITRSQTVVIDSKSCPFNPTFGEVKKSCLSPLNNTIMFSELGHDMELTDASTGHSLENTCVPTRKNKMLDRLSTTKKSRECSGVWDAVSSDLDDMDMTRSQTVVIDSKSCPLNPVFGEVKKSCLSPPNNTIMFSELGHDMELTDASTGHSLENTCVSTRKNKMLDRLSTTKKSSEFGGVWDAVSSDLDDMDMTRSQTVVIDSKSCPLNPAFGEVKKSCLSPPNNTVMFSELGHDMELTDASTAHSLENTCVSTRKNKMLDRLSTTKKSSECSGVWDAVSSDLDDMDMTRSQTVVIDSKSCPLNPAFGEVKKSCLSPPNNTIMFSELGHDMELTDASTGHSLENTCFYTHKNKTLDRLSTTTKNGECSGVWDAVSSDLNDMDMTRSQTVVIDSKYCGAAKASLSTVRKSLSCILPSSKALMFPTGYCQMQVPKALVGLNMDKKKYPASVCGTAVKFSPTTSDVTASDEPETTGRACSQTAARDCDFMEIGNEDVSKYGLKQNHLPITADRSVHCGSDSKKTQILSKEYNSIEITRALIGYTVKSSHPPTDGGGAEMTVPSDKAKSMVIGNQLGSSGRNSMWEAVSSEGIANDKTQSVRIKTRSEEMVNSLTSKIRKDPLLESSKNQLFSQTDFMAADENSPAPADVEGRQVCSLPITDTVPPPCLPSCQTVAEGNTGQCDQTALMSADLSILGEKNRNSSLVIYTTSEEGGSDTANSENLLTTDSSGIDHNRNESDKQTKSRRMSLADLQSKLQNIGHLINEKFDLERGCHTAPIPQLTTPSSPKAKEAACTPIVHPGIDDCSRCADSSTKPDHLKLDQQTNRPGTFILSKSKPWTARLSLGGFLPKLPRRSKLLDQNQEDITRHSDIRMMPRKSEVCVKEKDGCSGEVNNINEEMLPEISSEEDLSETVEGNSFGDCDQEASVVRTVVEAQNVTQGQKRPFPVDGHEYGMQEERKMINMTISSLEPVPSTNAAQWDSNAMDIVGENPPSFMTKTLDSTNFSGSSPDQRSHRSSQYEIQFDEQHEIHFQKKLEDGSITMREFLKLFGIYFNIRRPQQSVLPENFETDSGPTIAAVLLEKHINRPKQRVYEEDCQELSEMVEKLKTRMRDQDKYLNTTNEALQQVMKTYSDEQLQSFGTKLNERKVYFQKKSKSVSHELKIGLYAKLLDTTQVAQQNLTEKIEDMDELLKHLDECLNDLQSELSSIDCAGVEEDSANTETKLTIEAKQQELESLNMALADNERRVCELELEQNNAKGKVKKLQDETVELEKHITNLDRLTEWRLSEKTNDRAVFTFLYDSMGLEVLFEKPADEAVTDAETEQSVAAIAFQLELDEENSHCYARLVHNLLGQFIENESSWARKYPMSRHIPVLLHDVALVVSRCRLLGEEVHRLLKWGSLRLDILEIGCVENQVRILFSSLKAFAKFELTLGVTPSYPFTGLQLINFRNYIGNTRINQLEEIISSETPANNYLTRIVKRIHSVLLC